MHEESSLIYRAWKKCWESLLLLIFVAIAFVLKRIILGVGEGRIILGLFSPV